MGAAARVGHPSWGRRPTRFHPHLSSPGRTVSTTPATPRPGPLRVACFAGRPSGTMTAVAQLLIAPGRRWPCAGGSGTWGPGVSPARSGQGFTALASKDVREIVAEEIFGFRPNL